MEHGNSCQSGTALDELWQEFPADIDWGELAEGWSDSADDADDPETAEVAPKDDDHDDARHTPHRPKPAQSSPDDSVAAAENVQIFPQDLDDAALAPPPESGPPGTSVVAMVAEGPAPATAAAIRVGKARFALDAGGPGVVVGNWAIGVTVKTSTDDRYDNEMTRELARRHEYDEEEARRRGETPPPGVEALIKPHEYRSPMQDPAWRAVARARILKGGISARPRTASR